MYVFANPNPHKLITDDCVIRAIIPVMVVGTTTDPTIQAETIIWEIQALDV